MAAYGITAHRLSSQFNLPFEEAEEVLEGWYEKLPNAGKWIKEMRNKPHQPDFEYMITPMGRKRRFGLITDTNKRGVENEAVNFLIQSTASDQTLLSIVEMQPIFNDLPYEVKIVNTVHDSIIIEVDNDPAKIKEVSEIAVEIMEKEPTKHLPHTIPFVADVEVGETSWGSKKTAILDLNSYTGQWYHPDEFKDNLEGDWMEGYAFVETSKGIEMVDIILPD